MRKYLLVILTFCYLGCEDSESNEPESILLAGLWEWRYSYDNENSNWVKNAEQLNWWSLISEDSYSERFSLFWDTDTLCYHKWIVWDDSTSDGNLITSYEIFEADSATITLYFNPETSDDDVIVSLKAIGDTLIFYDQTFNPSAKAIRIDSFDFTPICDD